MVEANGGNKAAVVAYLSSNESAILARSNITYDSYSPTDKLKAGGRNTDILGRI